MKRFWLIVTRWSVYGLVFLLPWQTRWMVKLGELNRGLWEYGTYSIYAWDILLVAAVIIAWSQRRDRAKSKTGHLDFAILCLLGMGLLSFFWAVNRGLALFALWKLAEGGLLLWLLGSVMIPIRNISRWFVAGAAIQAGLGLLQFATQQSWANKWLGLASHDPSQLGTIVVATDQFRLLRAYAALPHPNMLGGLLAVGIIILFGLYLDLFSRINGWWESVKAESAARFKWRGQAAAVSLFIAEIFFLLTAFIILVAGLMVSFSRSAGLGLIVALAMLSWLIFRQSRRHFRLAFAKLAVVAVLTVGVIMIIFPQPWLARAQTDNRLEQQSVIARETYQEQAVHLFSSYWLTGTGLGNYTAGLHEKYVNLKPWAYQPVHNILLLAVVELGVLGMVVFGFLLYELIHLMYVNVARWTGGEVWTITFSAALVCLIVIGLFDHYLWSLHFGIMLWWMAVGMLRRTAN